MAEGEFPRLGFDIDTAGLQKAVDASKTAEAAVNKFADAVEKVSDKTKESAAAARAGGKATDDHGKAAQGAREHFERLASIAAGMSQRLTGLAGTASSAAAAMAGGPASLTGASQSLISGLAGLIGRIGPVGLAIGGLAGAAVAGYGAFVKLQEVLASSQDRAAQFSARLKNAYGDAAVVPGLVSGLAKLASETGLSFDRTADSFLRFARNKDAIGATRQEMLELTETVQKLGIVSGASSGEAASGLLQLSQALASGRLNGDELRSIMENMPALAKAIADGLGITVGQLRSMGEAGQLTSDKVFKAILSALPKAREEFKNLPDTVERATQRMADSWDRLKAKLGERLDSSSFIQSIINASNQAIAALEKLVAAKTASEKLTSVQEQLRSPYMTRATRAELERQALELAGKSIDEVVGKQRSDSEAAIQEAYSKQIAPIGTATTLLSQTDELVRKQKELKSQLDTTEKGLEAIAGEYARQNPEEAARKTKYFSDVIAGTKFELSQATDALRKYNIETENLASDLSKYGNEGLGKEIRQLQETSLRQNTGAIADAEALAAVTTRRKLAIDQQITSLNMQAEAEVRTAAAVGKGRDAEIAAEVTNRALALAFEQFGRVLDANDPKIKEYADALTRAQMAARETASAQALLSAKDAQAVASAGQAAAARGSYAIAAAQAAARIAQALRQNPDPALGQAMWGEFGAQQMTSAITKIRDVNREIALLRQTGGAGAQAAAQATFESQLKKELEEIPPAARSAYETVMRERQRVQQQAAAADSVRSIRDETEMVRRQAEAYTLVGREQAIALELTRQEFDLRKKGVPEEAILAQRDALRSAVAAQVSMNEALELNKRNAESVMAAWNEAAGTMKNSFLDAFDAMFDNSINKANRYREILVSMLRKMSRSFLDSAVSPFFNALQSMIKSFSSNIASMLGNSIFGSLFNGNGIGNILPNLLNGFGLYHSGGIVGSEPTAMRSASISSFSNAPRFHTGGVAGEVPIIAQAGEGVFTKGQMAALGNLARSGSASNVKIETNVTINGDVSEKNSKDMTARLVQTVRSIVDSRIVDQMRPGGALARA